MRRWYTRIVSLLLCAAIAVTLLPHVQIALGAGVSGLDEQGVYHISSFNDLVAAAGYSRSQEGNKIKYVLENDITITETEMQSLAGLNIKHLSFGSKDFYFLGEFDGQGHTITGLNYDNVLMDPQARTGLFAFVGHKEGLYHASIHDLTLKAAHIHADYCAGILVGDAYNTAFKNISIVDSSLSVNPANNALVLITDGGAYGGALAGYAERCTFYNCESRNTTVRSNSVGGVAALSGKPLYMGGLVGEVQSSVVEYCRVVGGEVKNRYETSVGALGGFTCYAGGLAGQSGGGAGYPSKLIDCFATCDVSFFAATYVSVGAGCSGHAGGLVGKVKDTGTMIKRCHYADGTISSYQYNTLLLMIPVQIANDVNRSGLVDVYEPKAIQVYDSYYNYADTFGPKNGKACYVLGDKKTSDQYGPQPDERYEDRAFWENRGYDFAGNLDRSVEDATTGPYQQEAPQPYSNKWVMYYYNDPATGETRGYPVHGLSVAGTFDFPGAGKVTLSPTLGTASLSQKAIDTTDPYRFAVLGIYPTERVPVDYTDGTATKGGVALSVAANEGYRFVNWYLVEDVAAAGLPAGQHEYFEKIFDGQGTLREDLGEVNSHVAVEDNQLYVARMEARVRFYDVNGGRVDVSDAAYPTEDVPNDDDDWYFYHDILPDVVPETRPESETATLIGWTTTPNVVGGVKGGYPAIDTVTLGQLRQDGAFYAPSSLVEKTMELYPVYADLVSNIITIYEGNELDGNDLETLREGYGSTAVTMEDNVATIHVTGVGAEGAFPEGVRFLGWYELTADGTAHLVSREQDFTLTGVDLTAKHIYEARFEYRVQFWLPEKGGNTTINGWAQYTYLLQDVYVKYKTQLFTSEWESEYLGNWEYNYTADNSVNIFTFSHWTDKDVKHDSEGNVIVYKGGVDQNEIEALATSAPKYPIDSQVGAPLDLYGTFSRMANYFDFSNYVTTDFPLSATVKIDKNNRYHKIVSAVVNPGYNYIFWDMYGRTGRESDGISDGIWSNKKETFDSASQKVTWDTDHDIYDGRGYTLYYTAHLTADVNFHQAVNTDALVETPVELTTVNYPYLTENKTVSMTRRYRSGVFGEPNCEYHSYNGTTGASLLFNGESLSPAAEVGAAPSREAMTIPGYYFVGWFEPAAWEASDLAYFLDVTAGEGEPKYQSSSIGLCEPYVLPADAVVEHTMELYPLYVKYHIESTTSVLLAVEGVVNKPDDPIWAPNVLTEDHYTLEVTAFNNVPVRPHDAGGEKYTIEYVTVTVDGGEPIKLSPTTNPEGHWVVTYPVVPGRHYLFTAVYKPYVVVFHRNGNTDTEVVVRDYGRPIAVSCLPTVQDAAAELNHALFVGWTEAKPDNGLYHFSEDRDGKSSYELAQETGYWTLAQTEDTLVTHSMELWPVYAKYTVDVNSNIDQALKDSGYDDNRLWTEVRSLERTSANTVSTTVKAKEVEGYKFTGWYTGVAYNEATGEYDDFTHATAISESEEYALEGTEPFTSKLYTAQYKKVYKVIYHGRGKDGGPVIYTNYLYEGEDEDKALNKKITEEVDQPRLDDKGEFVRDENGDILYDKVTTTYHQPLDPAPYHMIYATMSAHESFGQWECHEPDTPIAPGSDLVNIYDPWSFQPLLPQKDAAGAVTDPGLIGRVGTSDREINLYPTVWRVTVTDSKGNDITDQLTIDIDMSGMTSDYQNVKVYVCFDPAKPYTQDTLTVRVQRTRWVETDDPGRPDIANRGRDNVEVIPCLDAAKKEPLADSKYTAFMDTKVSEENNDDGHGYAVFTFDNSLLRIVKDAPTAYKGETFLFQVTSTADTAQTWRVAVTCDGNATAVNDDGSTRVIGCRGEAALSLPVGTYSVTEVTDWAWRLAPIYRVYVGGILQEASGAHTSVALPPLPFGASEAAKVICANQPLSDRPQWLWSSDRKENLFPAKTAGS